MLSGLKLLTLDDFPEIVEIEETGRTFEENARLKASGYAMQTGIHSLGDDSGLEVAALGDRPGVFSARYGGIEASYAQKMSLLLAEFEATGDTLRRARFVSSMAVAEPGGKILFTAEGICEGKIALKPLGSGGFGYDPLFIPEGYDATFGELPDAVKRQISHRALAFEQIIPLLRHFAAL